MTSPASTTTPATGEADDGACPVCPHQVAQHDRISLRYCAATAQQVARGHQTNPGCSCP